MGQHRRRIDQRVRPGANEETDMVTDADVIDARFGDSVEHRGVRLSRTLERTDRREDPHLNINHSNA